MRSTHVRIDVEALAWNLGEIRRQAPGKRILGMVKANAYGHGMIPIAKALQRLGVNMLGVAFVDEGVALRQAGITTPIMVLTPPELHQVQEIVQHHLTTVVCDVREVEALDAAATGPVSVHLYVDTGMHRDGVAAGDAEAFLNRIAACTNVNCEGILTHFATADEQDSTFLREQLDAFVALVEHLAHKGHTFDIVHAANTGATFQSVLTHLDMVRTGLSLYGYQVPDVGTARVRPILTWHTQVLSTRRVRAGETVSYGRRWMASHDTTVATIPVGYGDGYLRSLTGKAKCLIAGREYDIIGTMCMDECMVDIGDDEIGIGTPVVLLGSQQDATGKVRSIDATDIARWAGTIPYEITTAISARVPRVYVGDGSDVCTT